MTDKALELSEELVKVTDETKMVVHEVIKAHNTILDGVKKQQKIAEKHQKLVEQMSYLLKALRETVEIQERRLLRLERQETIGQLGNGEKNEDTYLN
jgi:hypothetical protein